jgi:F-type H+-transporting ATPase subunit epsilon
MPAGLTLGIAEFSAKDREMAFQCVIVTPEQQVLDERVSQVILPAHDGEVGILTGRAALLVKLGVGALRLDIAAGGAQKRTLFVDGGIAQMRDNQLTVLTSQAIAADEIDAETARAEYNEAAARRVTDEAGRKARDHAMRRGQVMQALARQGK